MNDIVDAGSYTITAGLHRGAQHTFITHRETGKQWVSNSPHESKERQSFQWLADSIVCNIVKFDPTKIIGSCDRRFWYPVDKPVPAPVPNSEFDSLVFIGD